MSDITAILASGSQLNTTVIKVQNEDELRLAQMGWYFWSLVWNQG
jgi:hypothetical protein